MLRTTAIICASVLFVILLACGGGGGGGGTNVTGVTVSPGAAWPSVGQTVVLTATVTGFNNQTVLWSANGGAISPTGPSTATYTAPSVAGVYTVTARADADTSVIGTCTMNVGTIGVSISPQDGSVSINQSLNFTASVTGTANDNVTWTASGGTITPTGTGTARFTAPGVVGNYTVTARSVADTNRKGVATVTVTPSAGSNAIINGKVVDQDSQVGISGVNVVFLNNVGTIIAQYTTAANGTFRATVPVTAIRFHIVSASIPGTYYKAYEYNGKRYTALSSLCSAPLPTLTAGTTISLPTFIDVPPTTGPPPPPPNGCP